MQAIHEDKNCFSSILSNDEKIKTDATDNLHVWFNMAQSTTWKYSRQRAKINKVLQPS